MSVSFGLPLFAIIPEVLRAQEITPSYTIELPDGERLSIAPEAQTLRDYLRWHPVPHWLISLRPRPEPLPMRHTDENFWYTYLATEDALYLQFNHVSGRTQSGQNLTQFVQAVTAEYEARSPQQLVVDVRHNLGGDNITYGPLLDWLSTVPTRIQCDHRALYLFSGGELPRGAGTPGRGRALRRRADGTAAGVCHRVGDQPCRTAGSRSPSPPVIRLPRPVMSGV